MCAFLPGRLRDASGAATRTIRRADIFDSSCRNVVGEGCQLIQVVIQKIYSRYGKSEFTLFLRSHYSSPVSSTLPKDGFKPALRERAFFSPEIG